MVGPQSEPIIREHNNSCLNYAVLHIVTTRSASNRRRTGAERNHFGGCSFLLLPASCDATSANGYQPYVDTSHWVIDTQNLQV